MAASEQELEQVRRNFRRAQAWAAKQSHAELVVHIAGVMVERQIERKMRREWEQAAEKIAQIANDAGGRFADAAGKLIAQQRARSRGGQRRAANDPRSQAMIEIRTEWERRRRPGASFARDMAIKYQTRGIGISEGGIKNAIGRWRRG